MTHIRLYFYAILSAILASLIMTYVALTTMFGPWIEPIVALFLVGFFLMRRSIASNELTILVSVVSGGIAGITAVACSFCFPALFFINKNFINLSAHSRLANPFALSLSKGTNGLINLNIFILILVLIILLAGVYSFLLIRILESSFFKKYFNNYSYITDFSASTSQFPESQLVHKIISGFTSFTHTLKLMWGAVSACVYYVILGFISVFTHTFSSAFSHAPIFFSLGVTSGAHVVLSLGFGLGAKLLCSSSLTNCLAIGSVSRELIIFSWCAGFLLFGLISSLFEYLVLILRAVSRSFVLGFRKVFVVDKSVRLEPFDVAQDKLRHNSGVVERERTPLFITILISSLASIFLFSFILKKIIFLSLIFILVATAISALIVLSIAARTGFAPLGRFATVITIPCMLFFDFSAVQAIFVSLFVELCCGLTADCAMGRKLAHLVIQEKQQNSRYIFGWTKRAQYIGLVTAACAVGIIFWFLSQKFVFGQSPLWAQRAYMRAVLVQTLSLKQACMLVWPLILCGFLFASSVKLISRYVTVSAMLVMTGFLLPVGYTVPFMMGSLFNKFSKHQELQEAYPFWSGFFAMSVFILIVCMIFF